mmetsp:Transcript_22100/g.48496  ORF Transcript_22100/g.48496 Transcript_22100/m.48496 type:complete len:323 (+) Transcript_22100:376-1344(+)
MPQKSAATPIPLKDVIMVMVQASASECVRLRWSTTAPARGGEGTSPSTWMATVVSAHASGRSSRGTDHMYPAFTTPDTANRKSSAATNSAMKPPSARTWKVMQSSTEAMATLTALRVMAPPMLGTRRSSAIPPEAVPTTPVTTVISPNTVSTENAPLKSSGNIALPAVGPALTRMPIEAVYVTYPKHAAVNTLCESTTRTSLSHCLANARMPPPPPSRSASVGALGSLRRSERGALRNPKTANGAMRRASSRKGARQVPDRSYMSPPNTYPKATPDGMHMKNRASHVDLDPAGAASSIIGAARLQKEASPTPTSARKTSREP